MKTFLRCEMELPLEGLEKAKTLSRKQKNGATLLQNLLHYSTPGSGGKDPTELEPGFRVRVDDDALVLYEQTGKGDLAALCHMVWEIDRFLGIGWDEHIVHCVQVDKDTLEAEAHILRREKPNETISLQDGVVRRLEVISGSGA